MRIITWNINGVRTLPQYHPWNTMSTFNDLLDSLEADILCFQEMKSSRSGLTKSNAVPPSYHAFFSFPVRKSGYSGVATYARTTAAIPIKAEEGLSAFIQPKPPLSSEERVSGPEAYPQRVIATEDGGADEMEGEIDYEDLDSEGRALVLDFGLFVLVNVYCPNDGNGTAERDIYKADFHRVLEARVKGLVEIEGREVIVVGDLNACSGVIDHCEGHLMVARGIAEGLQGEEGFWGKNVRRWLRGWMVAEDGTGGHMIDITRRLWPDRKGMYTCWNTRISAREANYGTRIDYILITRGLLPWVKAADIQPQIKGSDHCPVYLDLHDEIVDLNGAVLKLRDAMGFKPDSPQEPPRIASKHWDEYSGKQRLLQQFFGKPAASSMTSIAQPTPKLPEGHGKKHTADVLLVSEPASNAGTPLMSQGPSLATSASDNDVPIVLSPTPSRTQSIVQSPQSLDSTEAPPSSTTKRRLTADTLARSSSSKKQKQKKSQDKKLGQETTHGQAKLSTFFAKPHNRIPASSSPPAASSSKGKSTSREPDADVADMDVTDMVVEADHRLAMLLSSQEDAESIKRPGKESAEAWTSLLAPVQAPKCVIHGEPAKELTVTKPGPNKGKKFFICSRPVGVGYDKGRGERLREHVDRQWRCDFFKWSSSVRREMRKGDLL
ncbi:Endonuclease/exonuclease/phosphatase [Lyophyllum atratum]|nr:Endonuclease/exonuclease/phosphatase [Lyophyllum atratum]